MTERQMFTARECAKECAREIMFRLRVYPRMVEAGKMRPEAAARQTAILQQIMDRYDEEAKIEEAAARLL